MGKREQNKTILRQHYLVKKIKRVYEENKGCYRSHHTTPL